VLYYEAGSGTDAWSGRSIEGLALTAGVTMNPKPKSNGSGKVNINSSDMGGWVRIAAGNHDLPEDIGVYLSQGLADWFRQRPHLRLRCVVPISRNGTTVELHAWYEAHIFPSIQGPKIEPAKNG
jgi:hypothetical protein